jgi:DNA recombination protein RmuC
VRAVLKDVHLREQAHIIQAELRRLLDDVVRLDERVAKLQRHFEQATEDVQQIRISTEKVGKRAERIEELQVGDVGGAYRLDEAEVSEETPATRVIQ